MPKVAAQQQTYPVALVDLNGGERLFRLEKGDGEAFTMEEALTFDEAVEENEIKLYELASGIIYVRMGSPSIDHQDIVFNLALFIRLYTAGQNVGSGHIGNVDVRLDEQTRFAPDYIFLRVSKKNLVRRDEKGVRKYVDGAPDLVLEVLSPSTAKYDLTTKMHAYARAGVEEFWVVAPQERSVDVHALQEGQYQPYSRAEGEGTVASKVIEGFAVSVEQLFGEE